MDVDRLAWNTKLVDAPPRTTVHTAAELVELDKHAVPRLLLDFSLLVRLESLCGR
jgi:hypothetical protein